MGPHFLRGGGSLALRRQQNGLVHRLQRTFSPGSEVQAVETVSTWTPRHLHYENQALETEVFCFVGVRFNWNASSLQQASLSKAHR